MKERLTTTKIKVDTSLKLADITRELSMIERRDVKRPEVLRRVFNITNLKEILKSDAELKRRLGGGK